MNYKMVGRIIGYILLIEAFFMIPALIISLCCGEAPAAEGFLWGIAIGLGLSGSLMFLCRRGGGTFRACDGFVCVGLGWITLSLVGCIPFWRSGVIPNFINALFEMVSGFTTTGASILAEVEGLPYGILYWRSFSHWLGGMGVLVFLLALIPAVERGSGSSLHILRAESPGPDVGKLVPHIRKTAVLLYLIYIALTVLDVIFLLLGNMPFFEALCTAFGTAGTGGFGVRNDSIASYSPYIQNVCTVFMLLFGINFTCYYLLLIGQFRTVFRNEELRFYLGIVLFCILLVTWDVRHMYETLADTVCHAAFQVASIVTTTGFATTNFDLWPSFSKTILLCLMIIGACAGSTGGGIKCGRVLLLLKSTKRTIKEVQHPNQVMVIRCDGSVVKESVIRSTASYLAAYTAIVLTSFLLISGDGLSITTNFSAVLACFNNIGPGLELVGPTANYSVFAAFPKIILILDMLAGRLEIFPLLVLFSGGTWQISCRR